MKIRRSLNINDYINARINKQMRAFYGAKFYVDEFWCSQVNVTFEIPNVRVVCVPAH